LERGVDLSVSPLHPPERQSYLGRAKSAASFPEPGWMERDFLAAIGKEQQHPQQEKPGREGSGTLPGLLSPAAALGFLICARTGPCAVS